MAHVPTRPEANRCGAARSCHKFAGGFCGSGDSVRQRSGTNPGRFTIRRAGGSTNALSVQYSLSGTASNGVDYMQLSGTALFEAGARSTQVLVAPADDKLVEGRDETVVLTLTRHSTYHVGMSNSAVVTIHDSHQVPTVRMITAPNNVAPAGTNIVLEANALEGDAAIAKVEFFEGEHNLGVADGPLRTPEGIYSLTWSNVPAGLYAVRAKATDTAGAVGATAASQATSTAAGPAASAPTTPVSTRHRYSVLARQSSVASSSSAAPTSRMRRARMAYCRPVCVDPGAVHSLSRGALSCDGQVSWASVSSYGPPPVSACTTVSPNAHVSDAYPCVAAHPSSVYSGGMFSNVVKWYA